MLIRGCAHSELCPFGIVSIRDRVHSGRCPFGKVSIRESVHSGRCPIGIVSIRICVHSGSVRDCVPFGIVYRIRRAHVSAWNSRCTEERKTGIAPIKDTQNRSVPAFPHTNFVLKGRAGKNLLVDMATRWGGSYLLLVRLLELKCVVQNLGSQKSNLSEKEWVKSSEMVEIRKCPHIVTVALQKCDLTPSECLLYWKQVAFKLD